MRLWLKIIFAALLFCQSGFAQGFLNMDFENTTLNQVSGNFRATIFPWTVNTFSNGVNGSANNIPYNGIALDAPSVNLHGIDSPDPSLQPIQGSYMIFMQGGSRFNPNTNGATISQPGVVPMTAQTLIYWGSVLQVAFNGQMLSLTAISNAPNFTVWAANISAYAGLEMELSFTAPWQTSGLLDNV
jgi:hypothetical protein